MTTVTEDRHRPRSAAPPLRLDWQAGHGPVTGPLHAASLLLCVAGVGFVFELPPVWAGLTALAGAVAGLVWDLRDEVTKVGRILHVCYWTAGGFWLFSALNDTPWDFTRLFWLVSGVMVASLLMRGAHQHEETVQVKRAEKARAEELKAADQAEQDEFHALGDELVNLIKTIGNGRDWRDLKTRGVKRWMRDHPGGEQRQTGYSVRFGLPRNGVTWKDLAALRESLAAAMGLPHGCGIEVGPGDDKAEAVVHVATTDALRDTYPLPVPTRPKSINDGVLQGYRRDGSPLVTARREPTVALVGATGSGKSNQLNCEIAENLACNDVIVIVIDITGGALARPWLKPWREGKTRKPPIFWVAPDVEEAELVTTWLEGVIPHRKDAYGDYNSSEHDDDKLHVTPAIPQIQLIVDEVGTLPRSIVNRLVQISDTGRGPAVREIVCSLRGVDDYYPVSLMAQTKVRIALATENDTELNYVFGWGARLPEPSDLVSPGYGIVRGNAAQNPMLFKGPRLVPSLIEQIAIATDAWRPDLDEATLAYNREIVMNRWDRIADKMGRTPRPAPQPGTPSAPAGNDDREPENAEGSMEDAVSNMEASREALRRAHEQGPTYEDRFQAITREETVVPELLIRCIAAMDSATGDERQRMHTVRLAEAIGASETELGVLLPMIGVRSQPNPWAANGRRLRGYARTDLDAAAQRIRDGEQDVPTTVRGWQPPNGDGTPQ